MEAANGLLRECQEEPFQWHMSIQPSDYPDRTLALTEEEHGEIEYLLSLSSARYLEFERQATLLRRVTQPLMDVLALFQQRRPKSRVFRHLFMKYLLAQVLTTNTLYWEWSSSIFSIIRGKVA